MAAESEITSPKDADKFASVVSGEGGGLIVTAHEGKDGTTSYNLWQRKPGEEGGYTRVSREQVEKGAPGWESMQNLLAVVYISSPQDRAIGRLLDEVTKQIDES